MVADPKAMQYILHSSGYNFTKRKDLAIMTEMVVGENALVCAHGTPLSITGLNYSVILNPSTWVLQEKSTNDVGKLRLPRSSALD